MYGSIRSIVRSIVRSIDRSIDRFDSSGCLIRFDRSLDRTIDCLRRPNHMRSQIGGPKAMPPVGLRRLPGELHSIAKQASFSVAFRSDFKDFWNPKWRPKLDLGLIYFPAFSNTFFASTLGGFLEARNLKNH